MTLRGKGGKDYSGFWVPGQDWRNGISWVFANDGTPLTDAELPHVRALAGEDAAQRHEVALVLEGVEAATRKVIEMGYADPKRIGVTGHSYGGEGAAYIGVTSKMFAAIGMGAGVTDLFNDFSQNWGWAYSYSGGTGASGATR